MKIRLLKIGTSQVYFLHLALGKDRATQIDLVQLGPAQGDATPVSIAYVDNPLFAAVIKQTRFEQKPQYIGFARRV